MLHSSQLNFLHEERFSASLLTSSNATCLALTGGNMQGANETIEALRHPRPESCNEQPSETSRSAN
jgi:hypothetical protein